MRVLGRKKCTFVRFFDTLRVIGCFTALATLDAFFDAPPFPLCSSAAPWDVDF